MIETRVRDIRKMLPPSWAAEVVDGVIVVTSPELLDEADAVTIAQQLIREIEQPLTLSYTLSLPNSKAWASATETADSYNLALQPLGDDKFRVVRKDATPTPTLPRVQGRGRKKVQPPVEDVLPPFSGEDVGGTDDTGVTG